MNIEKIKVMVNGLPGSMAAKVAEHVLKNERFKLVPYSFTGPEITVKRLMIGSQQVALIRPDQREIAISAMSRGMLDFITADFTMPAAVNANADFYCCRGLPFVMGTTGGDRKQLNETVAASGIAAVIAPNMAKQIVGFQAMMEYAAATFPGLFAGYSLEIRESHQAGKADTSGTAKAMVEQPDGSTGIFNRLGIPFTVDQIFRERDPLVQKNVCGVPEKYLGGHAWHTYRMVSPDETVKVEFVHNVNGRDIYALGTLDAIAFLHKKVKEGARGKVFTMIDVLKG